MSGNDCSIGGFKPNIGTDNNGITAKKLKTRKGNINSIHVGTLNLSYVPEGGIGNLLKNGNIAAPTTTAYDA